MSESAIHSSLLDYYSDKASTSATMVLATIFGLFAILAFSKDSSPQTSSRYLLFWLYWFLWIGGLYFLLRFKYWSHHGQCALSLLMKREKAQTANIDYEISDIVLNEFNHTLMNRVFIYLTRMRARKPMPRQSQLIKLPDVLQSIYFGFGFATSKACFPETFFAQVQWWELCQFFFQVFLLCFFFFDFVTVLKHRRLRVRPAKK